MSRPRYLVIDNRCRTAQRCVDLLGVLTQGTRVESNETDQQEGVKHYALHAGDYLMHLPLTPSTLNELVV